MMLPTMRLARLKQRKKTRWFKPVADVDPGDGEPVDDGGQVEEETEDENEVLLEEEVQKPVDIDTKETNSKKQDIEENVLDNHSNIMENESPKKKENDNFPYQNNVFQEDETLLPTILKTMIIIL